MKINAFGVLLLALASTLLSQAQTASSIPIARRVDWTNPGYPGTIPETYGETLNILSYGGNGNGTADNSTALQNAIAASNDNVLTLIYFPRGTYRFTQGINITKNRIVLKGAGPDYTQFLFNNTSGNCIQIKGVLVNSPSYIVTAGNQKNSTNLTLSSNPSTINTGDYIQLKRKMYLNGICNVPNTGPNCTANQHYFGQIFQITGKTGNTLQLKDGLSMGYSLSNPVEIRKITMKHTIGIQDIKLTKPYILDNSGYKVYFENAANCWVSGIESAGTNLHHIGIVESTNIEVRGSHLHHAYCYDGNGACNGKTRGYGVYIGFKSTNCLIEDNVITQHRHAVVLSVSPNRNVIGYNFADNSQVNQSNLVNHGYYPHANLFEGNVANFYDIDTYWGYNGPYITAFRNKIDKEVQLYCAPVMNFEGNVGSYSFSSNRCASPDIHGSFNGSNPGILSDVSLYYPSRPDFISNRYTWPPIGPKTTSGGFISNTNPAATRYNSGGQFTINKRDAVHGYSIQNNGLFSGFNSVNQNKAVIVRNNNVLSIGYHNIYENTGGYWSVGPMTTARVSSSKELVISTYHTNTGAAAVYSSEKNGSNMTSLFYKTNTVITAITSGDFNNDGIDEIVLAYKENGLPRIFKSTNLNNLEETLIYTKSNVYWTPSAMTTGDFDNDGDDELVIGFNSVDGPAILRNDNADHIYSTIYSGSKHWTISALAAGDFDNDGDDELIEGFNSSDGPAVYKSENANESSSRIYSGIDYWTLAALTAGDLDDDGDDELVTGFNNSVFEGPNIYKSEDANSITDVRIYDKNDVYWNLKTLVIQKHSKDIGPVSPPDEEQEHGEHEPERRSRMMQVKSEDLAEYVSIYPNPTTGTFNVNMSQHLTAKTSVTVLDLSGAIVLEQPITKPITTIDISTAPKGVYIIRLMNENQLLQKRIVLQ